MPACPVAISRGMLWWFTEGKQCQLVLWLYPEGCCGGLLKESNASVLWLYPEGCCGGLLKESNASVCPVAISRGMLWWFTEGKQCTVSREGCCGGLLKESNALYPERDVVVVF